MDQRRNACAPDVLAPPGSVLATRPARISCGASLPPRSTDATCHSSPAAPRVTPATCHKLRPLYHATLAPTAVVLCCTPRCVRQEGSGDFFAVWDHWLLDTLTSWQRQSEASYAIDANEDEADGAPAAAPLLGGVFGPARMGGESADDIVDPASDGAMGDMPPRKRARPDVPAALGVNGAAPQALLADAS